MKELEETTYVGVNIPSLNGSPNIIRPSSAASQVEHVSGWRVGEERIGFDSES